MAPSKFRCGLISLVIFLASISLLAGCGGLPEKVEREASYALELSSDSTSLGRYAAKKTRQHPGKSAVYPLNAGMDAFLARAELIADAEKSIDVQYFIWNRDTTGSLLALFLIKAADKGVRVRMLLDDLEASDKSRGLYALSQHPNIEVRLFNPFVDRESRLPNFLHDFSRVNRRMHNKLMIADNQMAIIGGRNIGDEYFQASQLVEFGDMDFLTMGPVVQAGSNAFDEYWNSKWVYPIQSLIGEQSEGGSLEKLKAALDNFNLEIQGSSYLEALRTREILQEISTGNLDFIWSDVRLYYDPPGKADPHNDDDSSFLVRQLSPEFQGLKEELIIISPYFVPRSSLIQLFQKLLDRGVAIKVLTNSLASTDVPVVHAGYQKYRRKLLQMGVQLYEFRPDISEHMVKQDRFLKSSQKGALHAKAYFLDRRKAFVGSFNLDSRSAYINTEMGILIDNQGLVRKYSESFNANVDKVAYELRLDESSTDNNDNYHMTWIEKRRGQEIIHTADPEVGFFKRLRNSFLSILPLESQL